MRSRCLPLLLLFCPLVAGAVCPRAIRAGISELGYSGFQERGAVHGAAADVLSEAARRAGCTLNLELFPRARMFVQFDQGVIDVAASAARSEERDRDGEFVAYASTRFELVVGAAFAHGQTFRSLREFVDRTQGRMNIVRGAFYQPAVRTQLERLRQAGRLEEVVDFDSAFKKMSARRADATLAPEMIWARQFAEHGLARHARTFVISEAAPMEVGAYLSRRSLPATARAAFAQAIRSMEADGTILRIYQRYLSLDKARTVAGK